MNHSLPILPILLLGSHEVFTNFFLHVVVKIGILEFLFAYTQQLFSFTMLRHSISFLSVLLLLSLLPTGPVHAQTEGVGIGASIGVTNGASAIDRNPVGVNGKMWLSDRQAVSGMTSFYIGDAGTTSNIGGQSFWILQGDYLFHNFNELEVGEGLMALYIGAGAQFTVFEDFENQFAVRSPSGVTYLLGSAPIDIFVEVAPTMNLTEPVALRFDGAIGFRYYFPFNGGTDTGEDESVE